jgi:serine protease Do
MKPGSRATLNVWRNGKARDVTVTVAELKDDEAAAANERAKSPKKAEAKPGKLGVAVKDLTAEQKKELKVRNGVLVEAADGAALANGIGPGDVILMVNGQDVADAKAFNALVAKVDMKKPVSLLIKDEAGTRFITFRPDGD